MLGAPKPGWNSNVYKGLKEFAKLPESERRPKEVPRADTVVYRLPPPPNGLVILVYTRGYNRSDDDWLLRNEFHSQRYCGPQRNYLWLTEAEWKSLVPDEPAKSKKIRVADKIALRIFRHHLIDNTIGLNGPWSEKTDRAGELLLTVEQVSPSNVRLRLEGFAKMADNAGIGKAKRKCEFTFQGLLNYNVKRQAFDRFDFVALGDYHDANVRGYYQKVGQQTSLTLGIVGELATPESFGYGSVPFGLSNGIYSCRPGHRKIRLYFGTDPYTQ